MRFGLYVTNFGEYFHPNTVAELAVDAEKAGWEGFFLWDHILGFKDSSVPINDPWVALAAIALKTKRIRLGVLVTPIARRRPWKIARETITLDHLSDGRLIFGAGLGAPPDADFEVFGEDSNARIRAGMLDEGLEILTGLWSGDPFSYDGRYYKLEEVTFKPSPLQSPRIPVWIGGAWPNKGPFRRAAKWDGVLPMKEDLSQITPQEILKIRSYIQRHRTSSKHFDIALGGQTPIGDLEEAIEMVSPYIRAGLTWWLEEINGWRGSLKEMKEKIVQGPPKRM